MKKTTIFVVSVVFIILFIFSYFIVNRNHPNLYYIRNNHDDYVYKIGNEYFLGSTYVISTQEIIHIIESIEYGKKIDNFDSSIYPIENHNYIIELIDTTGANNHITFRFYDDFRYVSYNYGREHESCLPEYVHENVYILKNAQSIKELFLKSNSYIEPQLYNELINFCNDLLETNLYSLEKEISVEYSSLIDFTTLDKSKFFDLNLANIKIAIDGINSFTIFISDLYADHLFKGYISVTYTTSNIKTTKIIIS